MSPIVQAASIAAWQDETHVRENRVLYRQKFEAVFNILQPVFPSIYQPPASFYLWLPTPINDELFTQELFEQQHVTVLPGSYLSRVARQLNPGNHRVRVALVAPLAECTEAAHRIVAYLATL